MFNQLFIQSLAVVGLMFWGASYQFKKRQSILLLQLVGALFYIVHYVLLGAITGAMVSVVVALRLGIFYYKKRGNWVGRPVVLWIFLALSLVATITTFTAYWAIFAFAGSVFAIVACWQEDPNLIRRLFIPSHLFWIVYNIFAGSYGGIVSESVLLISTISSLYRRPR